VEFKNHSLVLDKILEKITGKKPVSQVYKMAASLIFIKFVPIKFTRTKQRNNDGISVKQARKICPFVNLQKRQFSW
jgi:hypothetical protein